MAPGVTVTSPPPFNSGWRNRWTWRRYLQGSAQLEADRAFGSWLSRQVGPEFEGCLSLHPDRARTARRTSPARHAPRARQPQRPHPRLPRCSAERSRQMAADAISRPSNRGHGRSCRRGVRERGSDSGRQFVGGGAHGGAWRRAVQDQCDPAQRRPRALLTGATAGADR